jgi:CRISPR-associated protein Cmr2
MMDGDSLGKNMSDTTKQDVITQGLAKFTQGIPAIVYANNGFLIYAGGDDVLAILPLEDAIPCATTIRTHYEECFKDSELQTSISGAIEFVHNKTSLTKILKDAHQLLDDVAKQKTGRDALAIRVWKPGGLQLQWSQPWEIALFDTPNGNKKTYLEKLAEEFQHNDVEDDQFSSKFLFKIRERFDLLNPTTDGGDSIFTDKKQQNALIAMEYLNSGNIKLSQIKDANERLEKAIDAIHPLLNQCRPVIRAIEKKNSDDWKRSPRLEADAALLVRFLAHKGIEQ